MSEPIKVTRAGAVETIAPQDLTPQARAFNGLIYLIPLLSLPALRHWRPRSGTRSLSSRFRG